MSHYLRNTDHVAYSYVLVYPVNIAVLSRRAECRNRDTEQANG